MEKEQRLALIQRSLGIRHKLKVHESMKEPDTHEELAILMMAKWELEDELHAIEQVLEDTRNINVAEKRAVLVQEYGIGKSGPSKPGKK